MSEYALLSDRLRRIHEELVLHPDIRDKVSVCLEMAQVIEAQLWGSPNQRTTDPETSTYNPDPKMINLLQEAVLVAFVEAIELKGEPIDEPEQWDAYDAACEKYSWMPKLDRSDQDTTVRKRRCDLMGKEEGLPPLIHRIDGDGTGPTGRAIGRYGPTMAGLEEYARVKAKYA